MGASSPITFIFPQFLKQLQSIKAKWVSFVINK